MKTRKRIQDRIDAVENTIRKIEDSKDKIIENQTEMSRQQWFERNREQRQYTN